MTADLAMAILIGVLLVSCGGLLEAWQRAKARETALSGLLERQDTIRATVFARQPVTLIDEYGDTGVLQEPVSGVYAYVLTRDGRVTSKVRES